MEEYFLLLDTIKKRYEYDSLYLKQQFEGELLTNLQKVVVNYYNELFNKKVRVIEKYSNFDMRVLGSILASIVSVFEGHQFVYQDVTITGAKDVNNYYSNTNYLMLVDEKLWQEKSREEDIATLPKESFIIKKTMFSSRTKQPTKSSFEYEENFYEIVNYYVNGNGDVRSLLKKEQFPYLKDFMDYVITYRMQNKLENIKEETLLALRKEFIESHLAEIEEKVTAYDIARERQIKKQTEELQDDWEKEKQSRKLLLTKVLDK